MYVYNSILKDAFEKMSRSNNIKEPELLLLNAKSASRAKCDAQIDNALRDFTTKEDQYNIYREGYISLRSAYINNSEVDCTVFVRIIHDEILLHKTDYYAAIAVFEQSLKDADAQYEQSVKDAEAEYAQSL